MKTRTKTLSRSVMATETTSQNELSEQVVFSGKIAKNRRCKNSNKCNKFKEKKHSGESRSDSDSEDGRRGRVVHKKPPPKEEKSGYSSSNETSDDQVDMQAEKKYHRQEVTDGLRRRKPLIENDDNVMTNIENTIEEKVTLGEENGCQDKTEEWELVDKCPKESDISLTTDNETSDDFWKSDSQIPLVRKEKAKKIKKPKSRKPFIKSWFEFYKRFRSEWKAFKEEHGKDLEQLRNCRNSCLMGFVIVFIYCGIGGIIFHTTEGAFEMFYKCGVKRVKRDFLDTLWSKRHYLGEEDWKSMARNKLMEFENQLYDAYEAGMNSYSGQRGWSFINSLVYCFTLVTTIGYGHLAPKTTVGRIITIVYSLFGVPMFLILLADYGKLFTRGIKFLWAFVRRLYYTGSCRKVRRTAPVQEMVKGVQLVFDMTKFRRPSTLPKEGEPTFPCPTSPAGTPAMSSYTIDDEFNLPVSVAFAILIIYMLAGAFFISYQENWSLFESFYFVYISILTIGLGDLVLSDKVFLISLIYLVFGLALTSMCINVVQEKLSDSFRQATAKIGATMGLGVTEDVNALNVPVINQTSESQ